MSIQFVEPDEITPQSASESRSEPQSDALTCAVCGRSLTYSGRGRRPKFCEEHRSQRSGGAATQRASNKSEKLRRELEATLGLIGLGVMAVDYYDGTVIMDRTPDTVDALINLAEHDPRVMKVLQQITGVSTWGAVGAAVAGIAAPIAAHHGVIPVSEDAMSRQFLSENAQANIARYRERRATRREVFDDAAAAMHRDTESEDEETNTAPLFNPFTVPGA